jgi:flagellin
MVINTNVSAQSSARLLAESSNMLARSLAKLSSGSKIVSPEDDAAGMAVSTRFDAMINRIGAAKANIGNAVSYSQTQDGFLIKIGKALDRMSELAILAQDTTKTTSDLSLYNLEFKQLQTYINNSSLKTFNGVSLFGNSIGVTTDGDTMVGTANSFTLGTVSFTGSAYSVANTISGFSLETQANAATAFSYITSAINQLAADRANVGANISRLNFTNEQLGVLKDNLAAANSRIKDVDVAEESTRFAKYNILVQAGTAMLAQANANPQAALRLLG